MEEWEGNPGCNCYPPPVDDEEGNCEDEDDEVESLVVDLEIVTWIFLLLVGLSLIVEETLADEEGVGGWVEEESS